MLRDRRYIPIKRDKLPNLMSIDARGTHGYGGGFGKLVFSYNRFGFNCPYNGIYSRKKTPKGHVVSLMKFYRPTNPQTVLQQTWRSVFSQGLLEWRSLDEGTKAHYKRLGRAQNMGGFNLFQRYWLNNHKLP